jgi:hypothetical protein
MKKENKIGISIILVLVVLGGLFGVYYYNNLRCSYWTLDRCDFTCDVDSDCISDPCGGCINKNEECSMSRYGKYVALDWYGTGCQCVENKCESIYEEIVV